MKKECLLVLINILQDLNTSKLCNVDPFILFIQEFMAYTSCLNFVSENLRQKLTFLKLLINVFSFGALIIFG